MAKHYRAIVLRNGERVFSTQDKPNFWGAIRAAIPNIMAGDTVNVSKVYSLGENVTRIRPISSVKASSDGILKSMLDKAIFMNL